MSKEHIWTADEVLTQVGTYMNEAHVAQVRAAYDYAQQVHSEQKRQSGEPYIMHPIQVAAILAELKMDPETIAAGFLHDVVEDTVATLDDLRNRFGDDVAEIVDGVTKIGKIKYRSNKEQLAENHRKLLLAMSHDIRVIIVKLADRLHNMRTLQHLRPDKQRRIANETLEIYAPLADRLGISTIKWELEDLSLRYLNPEQYYRIVHLMDSKRNQRIEIINEAIGEIKDAILDLHIRTQIYGRPKHIYSVYRKMVDKHKQFDQIYDLLAIRVIVQSIRDCYAVLGAIHTHWTPMPGRFKDYIAMPKANMYQSLHTTVIGPEGKPLEVQIRTEEMHRVAEYGVAAHWAYKEGQTDEVQESTNGDRLNWFKQIIELQNNATNADDFMEGVKGDLFTDSVYAFTPKGDVLELPKGAGPLDMAYIIHTQVGNHTTGAKVNGKIVPLDSEIKTGDIVDILTSQNSSGPSRDWVNLVHTRRARNKIKQYFRKMDRGENIQAGRDMLVHQLHDLNFDPKEIMTDDNLAKVAERMNYRSADDLLSAIGFGDSTPRGVANRLTSDLRAQREADRQAETEREILAENGEKTDETSEVSAKEEAKRSASDGVIIEGVDNLLVRLSHCCSPVPGDPIVGYITKGRGVSVHRTDCPNVRGAEANGERIVSVEWDDPASNRTNYNADIEIRGYNRNGMLNDVLRMINNTTKFLSSVTGKVDHNKMVVISATVGVRNLDVLNHIMDNIKNVPDVYEVLRATH